MAEINLPNTSFRHFPSCLPFLNWDRGRGLGNGKSNGKSLIGVKFVVFNAAKKEFQNQQKGLV